MCNVLSSQIWDTISADAKDFIQKLLTLDPSERIDATAAVNHPWTKSMPPLHKKNVDSRQTQKRQNTRLRLHSNVGAGGNGTPAHRLNSMGGVGRKSFDDDESSLMSDSTWNNYMKHKAASPLYKRQRTSDGNIVLPFAGGGFQGNVNITKDAILEDNASTMSPSNIDSVLATEDSNSQVSSQFGAMQLYFYKNMVSAQTPAEKQHARQEYLDYMKVNELKLPLQLPITMAAARDMAGVSGIGDGVGSGVGGAGGGMILPKIGSLKERKISVHEQFENIDEESEENGLGGGEGDGKNGGMMGLTKLDRMYGGHNPGYSNSMVSGGSSKSTLVPVEIKNASYIEKVGVWLNDSKDGGGFGMNRGNYTFNEDKYKISTSGSLLSGGGRTFSQKSNMTMSDHSSSTQATSFNRVTLPPMMSSSFSGHANDSGIEMGGEGGSISSRATFGGHHPHRLLKKNTGGSSDLLLPTQSFISNATSTTELLSASSGVGIGPYRNNGSSNRLNTHHLNSGPSSIASGSGFHHHQKQNGYHMDNMMVETSLMNDIRPGGGSFNSSHASSYQPLIK